MSYSNWIKFILLFVVGTTAGYYFYSYENHGTGVTVNHFPCNEPFTYSIGHIDNRFGLNKSEVADAMKNAAQLWSDALGTTVAISSENSMITVNFVYDNRQQNVDGEMRFRERINSEQTLLTQMQRAFDQKRDRFEQRSAAYVQLAEQTTTELNRLNEWVRSKNETGGFSENDVTVFEERKRSVESMQQRVLNERRELDRIALEINRELEQLNRRVEESNRLIDEYNKAYSGESRFTKATFQRIGTGGVITVNTFMSKNELTLILAHELGHALGLNHVSNPKSIMYSRMGEQERFPILQPTAEDLKALRALCD